MAINANSSDKQVVGSGAKWTGVANMRVVSISPTMEEMKAAGLNPQKEPEYVKQEFVEGKNGGESSTVTKNRVAVSLYHPQHKFYSQVAFFLEDRIRYNQGGTKVEWINKFGDTAWSDSETDFNGPEWFKTEGARPAYVGEGRLTLFVKNWANVDLNQQATLDDILKLIKGDYAELKTLHSQIKNNLVQTLQGVKKVVKDGKTSYYQSTFDAWFDRANRKDFSTWNEKASGEYGFKDDYQHDFTLKEYIPKVTADTPTNMDVPQTNNGEGASSLGSQYQF